MRVCFETFGCRLNRAEALSEEARYLAAGWTATSEHANADLIIVRCCSVTSRAEQDCARLISHLRRKYPSKRMIVRGCIKGASKEPDKYLDLVLARDKPEIGVPTRTARAYLKVQDGCSGKCTFCIVPTFRGKSVSVDFNELTDTARRFADAGYTEIVVTGCNLALYASQGRRLPELIEALAGIGPRIRIGSVEPGEMANQLIDLMAGEENICRYLHLPVQSASNKVLIAMNRPYSVADVEKLVIGARRQMPYIAVCADMIAGFPGEADIDFIATKGFLSRVQFSKIHVFPFSSRPGTVAAGLPDQVPHRLREIRAHEIRRIAEEHRTKFIRRFIGRTVEVVIEDEKKSAGWTGEYVWCECTPANAVVRPKRRDRIKVRVKSVVGHMLIGDQLG